MTASRVSISNLALKILGAKRIAAPDEDSKNGRACADCYEALRDALLEQHPWRFAIKRVTPALFAGTPAVAGAAPEFDFLYAFTLPTDFLSIRFPEDQVGCDWEARGNYILTNQASTIYLNYVARITDPTQFPPSFVRALAADMAEFMCEQLTQSNDKKNVAQAEKKEAIAIAKRNNAFLRLPKDSVEDPWLTCRL